ncbi:MAG: lipase family alpha/beta hydrolase [Acidimicrobiales bacterium]
MHGRRRSQALVAGLASVLVLIVWTVAPADGAALPEGRLPVSFSTVSAALAGSTRPGAPPPGANDWSCRPQADRPRPVVLVHGLGTNMTGNWDTISPLLANEGYCVFALTYGVTPGARFPLDQLGGMVPMESSAQELANFVDQVRTGTGASEVDLVAQSEGTLVVQQYLKFGGGASAVDHFVALTPLYQGTSVSALDRLRDVGSASLALLFPLFADTVDQLCGSCQQFLAGSDFLRRLNADGVIAEGVSYTNIVTRYDQLVVPFTSGLVDGPGVANHVVQDDCALDLSDHLAMAFDPVAARHVLNALDPAHAVAPVCTLVLAGIGGPSAATT